MRSNSRYRCTVAQVLLDGGASKSAKDSFCHSPYDVICAGLFVICSESTRAELESLLSPSTKIA